MQPADAPDLAHTRTRPAHWLATAAATAAVVALAALLQPDPATAKDTAAERPGPSPAATPAAPDPSAVTLPLNCGNIKSTLVGRATGDLDGDRRPETVVAARCAAGSGTPPTGVYVLTADRTGAPRLVATLLAPESRQTAQSLAVRDGAVTATLLGYSSPDVPSCCPDLTERARWTWQDGSFLRTLQRPPQAL
ncbi:hypothetical protein I3J09_23945 [Streptomyces clavuligerus]|uniref:hypothetical protein n=1 Tax=Streptomyces clavuligerus TaxID=1901 RepID=UPI00020D923A|nr:hypothetical protein [Streptomyces clavuligerus]ANW20989.1 hypothetical protein BB341_23630 [Streptomyces clavuligerus]AXU15607.1 hypothetical protein D1794_24550 [Streptomyces clavuligerus]MBY6305718.1 hypothetical protein [Streptomyces clavuligerus]QCS08386.1 hypothetical protein CRV15_23915 [Streptomyces clavuligerus]QPJ92281.1 hypothetical protein GE265_04200 [Streptomyces clavuligerus]